MPLPIDERHFFQREFNFKFKYWIMQRLYCSCMLLYFHLSPNSFKINFGAVLRYVKSCRNLGWQIQDGRYGASVTSFDQNYRCTWVFFTVPSLSRINFKIAHNNQTQVCCQTTSRRRKERGEKQWMSFKHLSFSEAYVCSVTMWSSMHANSFL